MAKSALLKSSIAKKYWMALTGLFLCLFLAGHLAGNLQLIFGTNQQFNEYALFMTTNPAVKLLSYVTYISIVFHAIDGIMLAIQNKKARPIAYAKNNPAANSGFASRNMAVLGTVILVFIATHMINFWAKMHFDNNMPLAKQESLQAPGQFELIGIPGSRIPTIPLQGNATLKSIVDDANKQSASQHNHVEGEEHKENEAKFELVGSNAIKDLKSGTMIFEGYKDLHKLTFDFFRDAKYGLIFTIGYVLAMLALGFHLWHGFASAFQSLGLNNPKFNAGIKLFGKLCSVLVPLLFAIIPLYIHFTK